VSEANGLYQGKVVDNRDPLNRFRLRLQVPQLFGPNPTDWADPPADNFVSVPKIGAMVWVTFHGGDITKPVWWAGAEQDVSGQLTTLTSDLTTSLTSDWSADIASNSVTDQAYTRSYAANVSDAATAYKILDASVASNVWSTLTWGSQDGWIGTSTYSTTPGYTAPSFIRQDGGSNRLDVPASGIYAYTAIVTFTGIGAGDVYALRALWQQNSGNTADYVTAQTGPFVGNLNFEAIASLSFVTDQSTFSSIRIQAKVTGGATALRDNVTGNFSGIATRTRVTCACIKRFGAFF
jgi:hypothetical protein